MTRVNKSAQPTRVCKECGKEKPIKNFHPKKSKLRGKTYTNVRCNICANKKDKKYKQTLTEEQKIKRKDTKLKWHYGIGFNTYRELYDKQEGACAICKKQHTLLTLHVDHCHKTGKVRGLLCNYCNPGLGYFKDSEALLANAIIYLRETKEHNNEI